ncbi:glycosyltransferase [Cellulomonas fengjieae]|uniref:Glycosyltransferase n=1 Tax=Cellulomonas fengjieae TaxID=2819978 RepID=A0ABS3SDQ0_9CELL|nr:glycosyltransferase [Cellulomonas fengjieae]MBO3083857.1 glycosyltransferase [Cellulomonas fengjieae]QVI64857.1 glycosyltransferase [Cellulomonas fengjieae]
MSTENQTPRHETPLRGRGLRTAEGWIRVGASAGMYSDGIEDELTELFLGEDDLRSTSTDLARHAAGPAQAFQLDADRANVVRGLAIAPDARVLEIGAGMGAITRYLGERAGLVDAIEPAMARARAARARTRDLANVEVFMGSHDDVPAEPTYDVVVVVGVLEYVGAGSADPQPYVDFLRHLGRCLKPGGTVAVAIENKLGVKYLVGAPEDHTDGIFDGIEGYPAGPAVRTFSRAELEALFVEAGLTPTTRAVFPDHKLTRAVMDVDALTATAPELLRNLPAFPSPDLRSPRPRLADEELVWRSFVDAGLAADVANSFLVLASPDGAQTLWPDDLGAVYFSRSRREGYAFQKRVVRTGDGLRIERIPVADPDAGAAIVVRSQDEPFVQGPTMLEMASTASFPEIAELVRRWRAELAAADLSGGTPLDLVPNNLVVSGDDLVPVDQEWFAPGWSVDRVMRRGLLWFAAMLVRRTPPSRWVGFATVRDVAVALGAATGFDERGEWLELALDEEAEFFALIGRRLDDDPSAEAARRRADLASMLDDAVEDLPLGTRLPDLFERVRGHLVTAEQSNAHLLSELEQARVAQEVLDRAAEDLVRAQEEAAAAAADVAAAQEAARRSEQKTRSAEAHQAFTAQRVGVAEERYGRQAARADHAEAALAAMRGSRAFKAIGRYYRLVDRLAPVGSRRRRAYSALLRRTVVLLRVLTGRRAAPVAPGPLRVPAAQEPLVTVVVPVYGKWDYTERCLRALAQTRGDVPFEVVVVDDRSPDDSLARLREVEGVRVVAHEVNTGYVGACNSGIAAARGELVVLLNNDTRVDPDWLEPLVRVMDDPTVGLVGSRLIYPDGRLQEAGGIIFSDASGWNYGKFCEPEDPAFTYRRDVDYVSGASIMVRREVLERLGGLDTRFAPAYYDDADLAFSVRALGLRTVYEPTSVVVHDEGISHGTDETSGIKAYQVVNRAKFQEKWASELALHLPPDAALVQRAARRLHGNGIVVVIDHYVPRADEDAGSVRMLAMMRALRQLGFAVFFVPDNRHRSEPYTRTLQDMGVEVLYGHGNLGTLLIELREDLVAVVASRVTVAWGYVVQVRSLVPEVPLVFDTVDLHFLREERAAQLAGLEGLPPKAVALRELELAMVRAADATVVVSSFERDLLTTLVPEARVRVLPTVHEQRPDAADVTPQGREGVLFVGSFAHPPNADGLRWFTSEVLPLLEAARPGLRVDVVGRDPLPELVESAPPGVTYHGWVEDLAPLYAGARVVIAPLRFGAGVKGKIGEAMSHGVPVVMTPVGAEGMDIRDGETAVVADDAAGFAAGVLTLLEDDETWTALSHAARDHIEQVFGTARFTELLADLLPTRDDVRAGLSESAAVAS